MNSVEKAQNWLQQQQLETVFMLQYQEDKLTLIKRDEPKTGGVLVDFMSGVLSHRRQFGGGRGEAIAKAVGARGSHLPSVLDATAGLGRDAFVLASIGCIVQLLERHPVVYALLEDGINRAYQVPDQGDFFKSHLILLPQGDLIHSSIVAQSMDVIYLDPMFPHQQKSAQVKKEMRLFQHLVGADLDADLFLERALMLAKKRVVVKRPSSAPFLANRKTTNAIKTKNHRFDLYLPYSSLD